MKSNRTFARLAALLAALALVATACGEDTAPPPIETSSTTAAPATAAPTTTLVELSTPPRVPESYADFREQTPACGAEAPPEAQNLEFAEPDNLSLEPTEKLIATINTSCGPIVVELDPGIAPETVNSFVFLAQQGYFNGTVSHRILPGFVIQAGDPTATGRGGLTRSG